MRQTNTNEKIDPLTRIQEEIKEVVRREEEYRQLTTAVSPSSLQEYDSHLEPEHDSNSNIDVSSSFSLAVTTAATVQDDNPSNTPSLSSSVNSKESLDGHHSDDSGISASSSPINGTSANNNNHNEVAKANKEQRYIGPNCYNLTPEPPQQKLMTRTVSTPHLAVTKQRQFTFNPAHKGVMQRFIASRGKLQLNNNNSTATPILLNGKSAAALIGNTTPSPTSPTISPVLNNSTATLTPAVIERDAEGRPIRPGYVPVEVKIQRELKDLKSRESELKKIRKIRESTSDLLEAIDNENIESDEDDSEVEHCYGPNQLRSAKSIGELCDSAHSNNSLSPRTTPSPAFDKMHYGRSGGMRPAMSLAQLCDLDPQEAPSSHRLIAQWESLIQQHA